MSPLSANAPSCRSSLTPTCSNTPNTRNAIVTYNREDYLALDRRYRDEGRAHHGVVILHPRRFPQRGATIGALIAATDKLLDAGPPYPGFVHWLR